MRKERPLYIADLFNYFARTKMRALRVSLIMFTALFFVLLLTSNPVYRAKATFSNKVTSYASSSAITSLLKQAKFDIPEESPISVMRSRPVFEEVIQSMGLQVITPKESFVARASLAMKRNAVREGPLFQHVHYDGVEKLVFHLKRVSDGTCLMYDENQKEVGEARVGVPTRFSGGSFTLTRLPKSELMQKYTALPMRKAIKKLRRELRVSQNRKDRILYFLSYAHPNREVAIGVLNGIMDEYKKHLITQHSEAWTKQGAFLHTRQKALLQDWENALHAQGDYLKQSLAADGSLDIKAKIERLDRPCQKWEGKNELLVSRSKKWEKERHLAAAEEKWLQEQEALYALDSGNKNWLIASEPDITSFEGIDLPVAETLYTNYCQERDLLYRKKEALTKEGHALASLAQLLTDPASQQRIKEASLLTAQLADTANRSEKERARIEKQLAQEQDFFRLRAEEERHLLEEKIQQLEGKMAGLQKVSLDLIASERAFLKEKMAKHEKEMEAVPKTWEAETQLKLNREIATQALSLLRELSEAKRAQHHLNTICSKPLEKADAPPFTESSHLFVLSSLGGALSFFLTLTGGFIFSANKGLPLSSAYLRFAGYPFYKKEELSLPELTAAVAQRPIVALLGGDYARALADSIALSGRSVLRVTFEGEAPLDRDSLHDRIGMVSTHQKGFPDDLKKWQKDYDCILLDCSQGPGTVQGLVCARLAAYSVLFITNESEEILTPFKPDQCLCLLQKRPS